MSDEKMRFKILSDIESGKHVFCPENNMIEKQVFEFEDVVDAIKSLEQDDWVKVAEYHYSNNICRHSLKLVDRVVVERITAKGEVELDRVAEMV